MCAARIFFVIVNGPAQDRTGDLLDFENSCFQDYNCISQRDVIPLDHEPVNH